MAAPIVIVFPAEITDSVWLQFRFALSLRDVEEMFASSFRRLHDSRLMTTTRLRGIGETLLLTPGRLDLRIKVR